MALTWTDDRRPVELSQCGIALEFVAAMDVDTKAPLTRELEIQRAPDSSGSPNEGAAVTIVRLPPDRSGGFLYVDPLPLTPSRYWYRARHMLADGAGDWSLWSGPFEAVELPRHKPLAAPVRIETDVNTRTAGWALEGARAIWRANRLFVSYDGQVGVASVKIATSTTAYPSFGTGTTVNGEDGLFDAGTFTYGQTVYITITPYPSTGAAGVAGTVHRFKSRLGSVDTLFDETSGKVKRDTSFSDGGYAVRAADTAGKEAFDDLFVLSTKTVKIGTVASPGVHTKTVRFTAAMFVPADSAMQWAFNSNPVYLRPGAVNNQLVMRAGWIAPVGATLTVIRARVWENDAGDTAAVALNRMESDALTAIANLTAAASAAWQTLSASISESVTAGRHYDIDVTLQADESVNDARLQWVEIDYTVPDYKTTL